MPKLQSTETSTQLRILGVPAGGSSALPVSGGVPFSRGQLRNPRDLQIFGARGDPLASQAEGRGFDARRPLRLTRTAEQKKPTRCLRLDLIGFCTVFSGASSPGGN